MTRRRFPIRLHHCRLAPLPVAGRYMSLPDRERETVLGTARQAAEHADAGYADLLAAEAAVAARRTRPQVARLVFSMDEDVTGSSAALVAAYDRAGRRLWHVDLDDEWPDETLVTDMLAAAWDWYRGDCYPAANEDADLFQFTLPDPSPGPRPHRRRRR
ncbi:hypothetical protein [Phytohabitans rumicis]|uniref:Uncharacterized protein n=1 Tax=Phytohabitans rumicis TaxID=1076125 RepID=A0A6V8L7T9_9ACTN|nr:hypothetical protein [Phytohabitans rumicis]GFJ93322.1 hypothetical protein Prum_069640 [Phytohabitans rumicis]